MTGIVSLGGLCSPALWMSRFVLPHGGPQLLLFRSLFSCPSVSMRLAMGLFQNLSMWPVLWFLEQPSKTFHGLYIILVPPIMMAAPLGGPLSSPQSSPVLSLSMSAATCRHLHNTSPLQLSNPGRPLSLPPGTWQPSVRGKEIDRTQGIPPLLVSSSVTWVARKLSHRLQPVK